jgi:hypothetical protein
VQGEQGIQGEQGVQGVPGEKGDTGDTGPAGVVQADLPITYDAGTQTVGSDGSLLVTVEHGGDDSEPRPSYAATVYWKGTVAPVNGANGDLWYDTYGGRMSVTGWGRRPLLLQEGAWRRLLPT